MTHLQSVLLMILSEVDVLLKQNNITYFLDGGTALGAIRHKGFIPWDDDVDIRIRPEDYDKFVHVCRTQLDPNKYFFEEAHKDWPLHFCKIKLKDTSIDEIDAFPSPNKGIYIDIFCMDNARKTTVGRFFQFLCGRIFIACLLSQKPYTTTSLFKKLALSLGRRIQNNKVVFSWLFKQVRCQKPSKMYSVVWDRKRPNWKNYFEKKQLFAKSVLVEFENRQFPVCIGYDEFLKTMYGDYMRLPPENKRVGLHIKSVDFGKY